MPTYDYQCRQCGRTTEVIHSMLEDGPTTCEHCGGPLRQVLHPAGIIFKGSGFYRNDSRTAMGGGSDRKAAPKSEVELRWRQPRRATAARRLSKAKATGAESSSTPSKE